jgi:ankyrin repeat protein
MQREILTTTANTSLSPGNYDGEDQRQGTPRLHMAAASPSAVYLQQVIHDSPPEALNAVDGNIHHLTPLAMAILRNLPENVAILLRAGADINTRTFMKNKWWPPLFLAAVQGHAETIEALISHGRLDPNQKLSEINGNTPLHFAAVSRKSDAARTLLRLGADPWSKCDRAEWNDRWTALDCAIHNEDEEMIRILEEAMEQQSQRKLEVSLQPLIENGGVNC